MIGTVIRLIHAKNFGFIRTRDGDEYFFHRDDFNGHWHDLTLDHAGGKVEVDVSFEKSHRTAKGLRAENVMRTNHPNEG